MSLPKPSLILPRQMPVPHEKAATKWEKFAKEKGIQKKGKRDRFAFNEQRDEFLPRWGKNSAANKAVADDWLREAKANDDLTQDPFDAKKQKKERTKKGLENQLKNQSRNGSATEERNERYVPKKHLQAAAQLASTSTASHGVFVTPTKGERKDKKRDRIRRAGEEGTSENEIQHRILASLNKGATQINTELVKKKSAGLLQKKRDSKREAIKKTRKGK